MSTSVQSKLDSKTQKAIAVSIGANYIDAKVFDWIDGAIKLNEEESKRIKDPTSGDLFTEHLVDIAKKEYARSNGKELAQIPVYVTNAAEIKADGGVILPFFKNGKLDQKIRESFSKKLYYPEESISKRLAEAALPTDMFKLSFGNDSLVNMQFAAKKFRMLDGEILYHMVAGQGSNIAAATIGANHEISPKHFVCWEPGHQLMPGIEQNLALEGNERKAFKDPVTGIAGASEPYVAGGNEDDPKTGPKATATNLMKLVVANDDTKLEAALKILNSKSGKNLSKVDLQKSKVFELYKAQNLQTRELGKLAKEGDATAQAILIFTASRIADSLADVIKKDIKAKKFEDGHKIALLTISGGLAENLTQNSPEAWAKLSSSLKENLGEARNILDDKFKIEFIKPKDKFDGTVELAEYALSQGKESSANNHKDKLSQEKGSQGFFAGIWNWIKSFFCPC